ncbi:MAG: OmpA-like protein transmembrane protein [uncultured bacterium]|nr:MAG: OmpA-like protein transmembrane protein [uncultured bacterium]
MNKMTKISAVILSSITLVGLTHAATPGAYVGAGLGTSRLSTPNMGNVTGATSTSTTRGGLGARLFGGYNFNKYFGLEAGYATYAPSTYKASNSVASEKLKYTLGALNVVAKGYLPFDESGFNAYVLGGIAAVNSKVALTTNNVPGVPSDSKTTRKLRPMYGIGVSYDVAEHVTTSLEASHIQGSGNLKTSNSAIPSANMLSLNLGYNFG